MHPPPLFQPKKAPKAHSSSFSSCGCYITTSTEDLGSRTGSKGSPGPLRAGSQLTAHRVFPRLRLQGLKVRSARKTVLTVPWSCPWHVSGGDMGSRASTLTISKPGPWPQRTAVPLLELPPEEIAPIDAGTAPESSQRTGVLGLLCFRPVPFASGSKSQSWAEVI